MKRGSFTSQIFQDKNDYAIILNALQKEIEENGPQWLSLAPQVDNFLVIQGVAESTSDDYEFETICDALNGVRTANPISFIFHRGDQISRITKLSNGTIDVKYVIVEKE